MPRKLLTSGLVATIICLVASARVSQADSWREELRPFLLTYCIDCHRGVDAEGELDLSDLDGDLNDAELMRRWTTVHDRLAAKEMPPKDSLRPSPDEKSETLAMLADALTESDLARNDVVLRRLNRNEYENTVRDLFGVYVQVKETLPQDTPSAGFDNVGEGLAVSPEAAGAYLRAADLVLDEVSLSVPLCNSNGPTTVESGAKIGSSPHVRELSLPR